MGAEAKPEYLVVAGPTAVGKSAIALEVAEELGGEIVIADSRQVYRGLEVGTAKPTAEERARVPHHLLDVVDLGERYTAADFAQQASAAIEEIRARGRVPVVCGGTGLYLAALAGALDPIEGGADRTEREAARARVEGIPVAERFAALGRIDPPSAERLHAADRQRVDRALGVWFLTGGPLSSRRAGGTHPRPHVSVRLERPRAELAERIDRRLESMLQAGLEGEVRALWEAGWTPADPGLDTIGYQEWWPHFEGERPREEAIDTIRAATRQYAKRQTTWFRNQGAYRAVPANGAGQAITDLWRRTR
ncbi:MAG: tRNA (adenosine(37)-N6)-dimethylallyltransferase MiaA [Gemmatimonadota bacterium]